MSKSRSPSTYAQSPPSRDDTSWWHSQSRQARDHDSSPQSQQDGGWQSGGWQSGWSPDDASWNWNCSEDSWKHGEDDERSDTWSDEEWKAFCKWQDSDDNPQVIAELVRQYDDEDAESDYTYYSGSWYDDEANSHYNDYHVEWEPRVNTKAQSLDDARYQAAWQGGAGTKRKAADEGIKKIGRPSVRGVEALSPSEQGTFAKEWECYTEWVTRPFNPERPGNKPHKLTGNLTRAKLKVEWRL